MLEKKREVMILLFLFYRNAGVEGEENGRDVKEVYE